MKKICKYCQTEFEPKRSTKEFCSANCRVKWNNKKGEFPIKEAKENIKPEKHTIKIYKLISPIDNSVFYIGKTFNTIVNRLNAHIKEINDGVKSKKREIIKSIIDNNLTPLIEEIESFECKNAEDELVVNERELYWIEYFNSIGNELSNVEGVIRPYKNKPSKKFINNVEADTNLKWIAEIEAICNEQGILPEDMVKQWKEMWVFPSKDGIPKNKHGGFENFGILKKKEEYNTTTGLSKWQLELRKKKLGI